MKTSYWRNGVPSLMLAAAVLVPTGLRAGQAADTTFTGKVSDAMCGVKHDMGIKGDANCVRVCVKGGMAYALVVGEKAYTLATKDQQQLATLNKYANERVVVRGTLAGTTLTVHSVAAASH